MEEKKTQALSKQKDLPQTEMNLPLTLQEKEELQECEVRIEKAKELIENATLVILQEFAKIRAKKLYRETHRTLEDYIEERFGYTRPYAQNLAQWGDFINVASDVLQASDSKIFFSINAIKEMVPAINRIGENLGLGKSEFNILKPIINSSIRIMIESVPRAKNSASPKLSPRNIETFYTAINNFIQESIVEIQGKLVTVAEAKKQNLLNSSSSQEIVSQIAEKISEHSEIINLKTSYEIKPLKIQNETEKYLTTKWRSAELLAKEYLESQENILEVEDVSESNLGYDLEVHYRNNERIYVEVKKVSSFNEPFKLTNNEFACANSYGESYRIALVIDNPFQIKFISNPTAELEFKRVVEKVSWKFGDYSNSLQEDL